MAKLNMTEVISGAQKAIDAVQELLPLAQKIGGPTVANVATIAIATIGVIENVLQRGQDAHIALTTKDEAQLRAMLEKLQEANDKLASAISSS